MSFDFAHLYCVSRLSVALQTALAAPSLVFCPCARTCSLHHSYGYDSGREYAHTGKILRDHRGPWCNMRVKGAATGRPDKEPRIGDGGRLPETGPYSSR